MLEPNDTHMEPGNLSDYPLTRDRERRDTKNPSKYDDDEETSCGGDANLITYAFNATLEPEDIEP